MAYQPILDGSGQATVWLFDNEAKSTNVYDPNTIVLSPPNGQDDGGIRTFTWPNGRTQKIYIRCKKVGEELVRGELSKDYYDSLNKP